MKINEKVDRIENFNELKIRYTKLELVIDRVITKNDNDFFSRLADAIEIAFYEGNGYCSIENVENSNIKYFSNNFELDGIKFLNQIYTYSVLTIPMEPAQNVKDMEI